MPKEDTEQGNEVGDDEDKGGKIKEIAGMKGIQPADFGGKVGHFARSLRGITSFKPDQVSSTAQTLMSTRPFFKAISRTTFSFTSVGILEAALGQDTQIMPWGAKDFFKGPIRFSRSFRFFVKKWMKSMEDFGFARVRTSSGSFPSVLAYPDGAFKMEILKA